MSVYKISLGVSLTTGWIGDHNGKGTTNRPGISFGDNQATAKIRGKLILSWSKIGKKLASN